MTLSSNVNDLAGRIASEFNTLRSEIPAGGLTVSETSPVSPTEGDLWFSSANATTYVYYDSAWVEVTPGVEGPQGPQGEQGIQGETGPAGPGIAAGGIEGQILSKVDGTDYNTTWIDNYAPDTRIIVKNDSGASIPLGTAVMAVGAVGDQIQVTKAIADGSVEPRYMLGVAFETIANGESGYVTLTGDVKGVDTSAYTVGDVLYLSPTTPGGYVLTEPSSPELVMPIAIVTKVNASSGRIFVRMWAQQSGLHELHDVLLTNVADGQALVYNGSLGLWVNGEGASGGLTVSETAPLDPAEGDMWFASSEARTYVYYDSSWVEMNPGFEGPEGPAGPAGDDGVIAQAEPPSNTSVLWLDTDDDADILELREVNPHPFIFG